MLVCEEVKKGNVTDGFVNIHHCDLSWSPAGNASECFYNTEKDMPIKQQVIQFTNREKK